MRPDARPSPPPGPPRPAGRSPRDPAVTAADPRPSPPAGTIRPRRGLPSSRAAIGGLLVTIAALGVWLLAGGASKPPAQPHVVAARPLAAGHRIVAGDLRVADLDLPATQRGLTFEDPADLIDRVTLGPIAQGELVQGGSVGGDFTRPEAQLSFAVDAEWAVAGALEVGDRIDVYATDDDAAAATNLVLKNVTVEALAAPDGGGLGDSGRLTITVSGPDADDLGDAVAATRTATLTVVRVSDARTAAEPAIAPSTSLAPSDGEGQAPNRTERTTTTGGG